MAECVLKNNVFEHNIRFFKQLHRKTIEAKFGPQYAILFWGYLEDKILNFFIEKNSRLVALHWWYFYDSAKRGREFLKILNSCHPTIKLDAKHSLGKVKFLDVEVISRKQTPYRFMYQTYGYSPTLRIFILSRVSF